MKDIKEFKNFYEFRLINQLKKLENSRYIIVSELCVVIVFLIIFTTLIYLKGTMPMFLLLILVTWIYYNILKNRVKNYRKKIKKIIVNGIIEFINPKISYYPDQYISYEVFEQSSIFPLNQIFYYGEDYLNGKIGDINFEICELKIYKSSSFNSKISNLFKGIFFHAIFSYEANGKMLIIPKKNWQKYTHIIKNMIKYGAVELDKTDNILFDSCFRVFYEENIKTEELLNDIFIRNLTNYYTNNNKEIIASFNNNHFYMAVSENINLLDRLLLRSNIKFNNILEYYLDFKYFIKIVEDFDQAH